MAYGDVEPGKLVFAPARYPGHKYEGRGTVYTIRVGYDPEDVVGYLSVQGNLIGFVGTAPPWTPAGGVRVWIQDELRRGAALNVPPLTKVQEILAAVWHDPPQEDVPLDGLQSL